MLRSKVKEEHVARAPNAKKVFHYAYDYDAKLWRPVACDSEGNLKAVE